MLRHLDPVQLALMFFCAGRVILLTCVTLQGALSLVCVILWTTVATRVISQISNNVSTESTISIVVVYHRIFDFQVVALHVSLKLIHRPLQYSQPLKQDHPCIMTTLNCPKVMQQRTPHTCTVHGNFKFTLIVYISTPD